MPSSEFVAGIDPGKTGGYGIFELATGKLKWAAPLEYDNPRRLYDDLKRFHVSEVLIERAQAAAGDAGQFEYGRSMGRIEGVCAVTGARVLLCAAAWWKARLAVPVDKAKSYAIACERWPNLEFFAPPGPRGGLDKVHGTAEGCLIGSVLLSKSLYQQLTKNNAARVKPKRRRPSFAWTGD